MQAVTSSVEFGVFFTIGLYVLSKLITRRANVSFLNPLFLAIVLGVSVLLIFDIDPLDYQVGGAWVGTLLAPATVCLVVPFYKQSHLFKANWKPVIAGILAGSIAGLLVTALLVKLLNIPELMTHALLVKNTTGPIALEIAQMVNRPTDLVMLMVIFSGVFGFMTGNLILNAIKVDNKIARGIAFGNTSHIVGTAKAMSNSVEEGAMSSISILLTGLVYLVLVPFLLRIM